MCYTYRDDMYKSTTNNFTPYCITFPFGRTIQKNPHNVIVSITNVIIIILLIVGVAYLTIMCRLIYIQDNEEFYVLLFNLIKLNVSVNIDFRNN